MLLKSHNYKLNLFLWIAFLLKSVSNQIIIFFFMRNIAVNAGFYSLFRVFEISAALVSKVIEGTVAE